MKPTVLNPSVRSRVQSQVDTIAKLKADALAQARIQADLLKK